MKSRDTGLLLLLGLIWGSAFLMIDVVVREVDPLTSVAGRLVIGAVMLSAIALATGRGLPPRSMLPVLLVLAVFNNVIPFALITWAQQHIDSSLAATLNSTMPLFTFALAASIGSERFDAERTAGLLIGFVGAAVLIGPDVTDLSASNGLGDLAVIGGSLCYAIATVIARQRLRGEPLVLASGQMTIAAIVSIPLALAVDGAPRFDIGWEAGLSLIGLGVFSSGFAYIIFFTLIQRVSATSVSVVSYVIPVVATVLGWLVLDESIGVNLLVGLALVIAGMLAVNGGLSGLFRRASAKAPTPAG